MSVYKKEAMLSGFALVFVAMAWGASYAITKDALDTIRPFALMTLRFSFSTIILAMLFNKRLRKMTGKDLARGAIIGIFLFLSFLTLIIGLNHTTASKQSFIVGSYVLIVPFLAWGINKRRPDKYAIAGAVMATMGLGLLTINKTMHFNLGDSLSLLCAFMFAGHMISIEWLNKESDPIVLTIVQFAVTSILFILFTGIFESFDIAVNAKVAKSIIYLVLVSTVIGFAVQNVAQKYISSTSTALILTLESAFGSSFAVYLLHESMTIQMIWGCVFIFAGIITRETQWSFLTNRFKRGINS